MQGGGSDGDGVAEQAPVGTVIRLLELFSRQLHDSLAESEGECAKACAAFENAGMASSRLGRALAGASIDPVLRKEGMTIRESLNAATMALQFHDRLAQQVHHVRRGLHDLQRLIDGETNVDDSGWDTRMTAWERRYDVEHRRLVAREPVAAAENRSISPGDSAGIELF